MTRVLVVWCPDWPLVAAGIPPQVPAAAFHANRVIACTAAARAEGVRKGLRRREAQGRCPDLAVEQYNPARDARAFEPVIAAIETFTTGVELSRPGMCALATRGPSRYFGGDEALSRRIREKVDAVLTGLPGGGEPCRVGIADGPFAAAMAARRDTVVPPGESAAFLSPFPIGVLDEPELTDLLRRLGVHTLGAFAALPAAEVVGRFGPVGEIAHRRSQGLDDRDVEGREPPPDLAVQVSLDPPADRVDTAAFAAKSMADELCGSLAAVGLACTCLVVEAETEHGELLHRVWRHHRAFTPATIAERVRWQLDAWLAETTRCGCPPGEPCPGRAVCPNPVGGTSGGLILLRLAPEEVDRDHVRQGGFWGGTTEADERAARGLARVQALLGPEGVVTAVLGGGRGPLEQARMVPWGEPRDPARPGPPGPPNPPARPGPPNPPARPGPPNPLARPGPPNPLAYAHDPAPARTATARAARANRAPSKAGTRVRSSGRSPSPSEQPAWPGRVPSPFPICTPVRPQQVEVIDAAGTSVGVTSRSLLTSPPVRLSIAGAPWASITAWAGPWTADERWWDPAAHRRRARLQVVLADGAAHLVTCEGGRWWLEASYD